MYSKTVRFQNRTLQIAEVAAASANARRERAVMTAAAVRYLQGSSSGSSSSNSSGASVHPRVRHAALTALGQMATDHGPDLQVTVNFNYLHFEFDSRLTRHSLSCYRAVGLTAPCWCFCTMYACTHACMPCAATTAIHLCLQFALAVVMS